MSIENIVLIAYQIFKNILNLLGQGVAESQPNCYPRISVVVTFYRKKIGPPIPPRKKFVYQPKTST